MGQVCSYLNVYFCNWFILEVSLEMALLKINHFRGKLLESFMVMVGDCKYLGHFQNHRGCILWLRTGGTGPECPAFQACQDCFLSLVQMCFFSTYVWRLNGLIFRNKSFQTLSFFSRWLSLPFVFLNIWIWSSLGHINFSLHFFLTITPTRSSTFVQNTVVKHVPWATAIFYDISVKIRQRRLSGWT